MIIDELLRDIAIDGGKELFLTAVERFYTNFKSKDEWKKLFVDTGEFFIEHENNAEPLFDDLALVLSKTNMEKLAREFEKNSGYELKERLLNSLIRLMKEYEIPRDVAYSYSYRILSVILNEIQLIAPEKYDRQFQFEWRKEEQKTLLELKERIEKVREEVKQYESMSLGIHSAEDMELELRRSTDDPKIDIAFFEIDDDSFKEAFSERKDDSIVCIRARCKEEAVFCIINELWCLGDSRALFVVDNKNDWEKLSKIKENGNIYIPRFYDEEIIPIENNTNIFIYTDGYPSFSDEEIELRPRTLNTLQRLLNEAGLDYEKAYKLIDETHGLYVPLKKKLFHRFFKLPVWISKIPDNIKAAALLMGKWTDADGDKLIAEELSGVSYNDFIAQIMQFASGEDPFIHLFKGSHINTYMLASAEISWEYIDVSINSSIWTKFVDLFNIVINESEKLFTYSNKERLLAQFKGEILFFSPELRKGMLHSIILKAYYKNDPNFQYEADRITQEVLDHINVEDKWRYFANFFESFCEISPSIILKRINNEFEKPTGLLKLFESQSDNFLFERNPYINIMWGVEQFLSQERYALDGLRWFLRLYSKAYNYTSNSPKDTLIKVFCAWYSFSSFNNTEKKTNAAKLAFKMDQNIWGIILEALPYNHRSIIGKLSSPQYRLHDFETSVTNIEMINTIDEYISLLVYYAGQDSQKWNQLIDIADELSEANRTMIIEELCKALSIMTDDERLQIYDYLRNKVYNHRFYNSAAWATKESVLDVFVALIDKIKFDSPEYYYEYLFHASDSGIILDPIPYDEKGRDENEIRIKKTIEQKLAEFREKNLSLLVLCSICGQEKESTLGKQLAEYWDKKHFNKETYVLLYNSQTSLKMAKDYVAVAIASDKDVFNTVMDMKDELKYDISYIVSLYKMQAYTNTKSIPAINEADETVKREFWKEYYIPQSEMYAWVLEECYKYGNLNSYIGTLFFVNLRKTLPIAELLKYVRLISRIDPEQTEYIDRYHLRELLKPLQKEYMSTPEIRAELAALELRFYQFLEWDEMLCIQNELKYSPELYAEIAKYIFKSDVDKQKTDTEKRIASNLYSLFLKAKFCPGEQNGTVDEKILLDWVGSFKMLLAEHKQENLFGYLLGRLLAHSPVGSDGYYPCEQVRRVIEDNDDDDLISSYRTEIYNERGIFSPTAGKEELLIANRYKENAEHLAINFPRTASIYYELYKGYVAESKRERENAENGQF